ncbi:MAG TPA: GAF domain-containing SpoIIE family protein phosphatase [Bacteroidota bacterium]
MAKKTSQSKKPAGGVKSYVHRLESLIDASKHLNTTFDLDKLLSIILNLATKNLNAERGTIYLIDDKTKELWSKVVKGEGLVEIRLPIGTGISGTVAETGETINLKDASKDTRFYSGYDKRSGFRTKTMLCMPMKNRLGKIIGVFQIINKKRGAFDEEDELFMKAFSEHAALAIENARLYQTSLESERVQKELQIAGEIQQRLLPKEIVPIPHYEIAAAAQPCTSVGGDFYDVIALGNDRYAFVMADVTGKGVPAALLVSTLHASLRAYIHSDTDLAELTAKLNNLVYENSPSERFITFFIMILDCNSHSITYVNAGHNFPYLFHPQSVEILELEASGLPLGMVGNVQYESKKISLGYNDVLALYTDGVTEAMDKGKQQYSEERLKRTIKDSLVGPAHEIKDNILKDVRAFIGHEPPSDDLTLLVLKQV